jgi:hypothetical protein
MGTLTTVDDVQYYFDPSNIAAISDYDPAGGGAVTCVYGISTGYLMVAETPQAFMAAVGIAGKLVQLTRPDDTAVWINGSSIVSIRSRVASDGPGVNALIFFASMPTQGVKEAAPAVAALFKLS